MSSQSTSNQDTPETERKLSYETKRLYYTAEFQSLGDVTKDRQMSLTEFIRLLMLLGYPDGPEGAQKLWISHGESEEGHIDLREYMRIMSDLAVDSKTDTWRRLFAKFDTDGTGYASKAEVIAGLEDIGIEITSGLRTTVETMDANSDGRISYAEFLKKQLRQ